MTSPGRELKPGLFGKDVALLHTNLAGLGFVVDTAEQQGQAFGAATAAKVREFQQQRGLPVSGVVDTATHTAIQTAVGEQTQWIRPIAEKPLRPPVAPALPPVKGKLSVAGRIYSEHGVPAAGLGLRLYQHGFGAKPVLLTMGVTGPDGGYLLAYDPPKGGANIEVRAMDPADPKREVSLSQTVYGAAGKEQLSGGAAGDRAAGQ